MPLGNDGFPTISWVLSEMHSRYNDAGLQIIGGYADVTNLGGSSRTQYVAKNGTVLSSSAGIAVDESIVLHGISEILRPKNILIIGNSYGISTVFLALSNSGANLVAIDKYRTEGLKQTKALLVGLPKAEVVQASTPDDLELLVAERFRNGLDLVLLDAVHENDIQTAEYQTLRPHMNTGGVIVMHDVLSCNLLDSVDHLKHSFPYDDFFLCGRTTSGIAVSVTKDTVPEKQAEPSRSAQLANFLSVFEADLPTILGFQTLVATEHWQSKFRVNNSERVDPVEFSFPPHPQT